MHFLTIQDGVFSLNVNLICDICWENPEAKEATIRMASREEYACEGEDYDALLKAIGFKQPVTNSTPIFRR